VKRAGERAAKTIAVVWCVASLGFAGWVLTQWWTSLSDYSRMMLTGLPLFLIALALALFMSAWAWNTVERMVTDWWSRIRRGPGIGPG
jgi:TRAP-type C4-dicarboxylate transport system permease small subunit